MNAKTPAAPDKAASSRRKPAGPVADGAAARDSNAEAARRLWRAELLLELSRKVAALETLDEVLETLVGITTRELGAERGTLFLNDSSSNELYSRVAQGDLSREIRILNNSGISGHV